jgi:Domain of unknown function (DUF4259)
VGAWGTGSFENDDAKDWAAGVDKIAPEELTRILARAADDPEYLEAPAAYIAVAAAEAVAAFGGAPGGSVPAAIIEWATAHPQAITPELKGLAIRTLERVRTNSEVKDLWMQADGLNDWIAAIRELQGRLGG